jgi:ribosomal protein S18 acetylase RimI-like enzyme
VRMDRPEAPELRLVEVVDERTPLARAAFELIHDSMWDVAPLDYQLAELEETRRGLAEGGDFHLLALVDEEGEPAAAACGVYLEAVNAGFITYLAVREDLRNRRLGRELRAHLVEALRAEARDKRGEDLAWVAGEVRRESPWLRTLVRGGRAIAFDVPYFHPWLPLRAEGRYVLYREPVADRRAELPSGEVAALLWAIWQRAYGIRFPLQRDTFTYMLQKLEGRATVGADPGFEGGVDT